MHTEEKSSMYKMLHLSVIPRRSKTKNKHSKNKVVSTFNVTTPFEKLAKSVVVVVAATTKLTCIYCRCVLQAKIYDILVWLVFRSPVKSTFCNNVLLGRLTIFKHYFF